MEESILISTKAVLNVPADHTEFDEQILMFINSAVAELNQLGVGPDTGFVVESDSETWSALLGGDANQNMVRSYLYLRVRLLFDPPATSFNLNAMENILKEYASRINIDRESDIWTDPEAEEPTLPDPGTYIDGGVL